MICDDCAASAETNGAWRRYNAPQCVYCVVRLMRAYASPEDRLKGRFLANLKPQQSIILKEAIAYGHGGKEIRRIGAHGPYVQPIEQKAKRKG